MRYDREISRRDCLKIGGWLLGGAMFGTYLDYLNKKHPNLVSITQSENFTSSNYVVRKPDGTIWFDTSSYRQGDCQPPGDIPQDLAIAIVEEFGTGELSIQAVTTAWSENGKFISNLVVVNNGGDYPGSRDVGYFMINFDIHKAKLAEKLGVYDVSQLFDAKVNTKAAKLIYQTAGNHWGPWWGPRRVNCNIPQ